MLLTLFESLKVVLTIMVAILIMLAKLATLSFLKKKTFWNKVYFDFFPSWIRLMV